MLTQSDINFLLAVKKYPIEIVQRLYLYDLNRYEKTLGASSSAFTSQIQSHVRREQRGKSYKRTKHDQYNFEFGVANRSSATVEC